MTTGALVLLVLLFFFSFLLLLFLYRGKIQKQQEEIPIFIRLNLFAPVWSGDDEVMCVKKREGTASKVSRSTLSSMICTLPVSALRGQC